MTIEASARVYKLSKDLRTSMKEKREEDSITQANLFAAAVADQLDAITTTLLSLGFEPTKVTGPVKVNMDADTLKALYQASAKTGIPQTALIQCCLILYTGQDRKARTRKATPKARKTTTRARKARKATPKARKTSKTPALV